jgi:hypothetical protein
MGVKGVRRLVLAAVLALFVAVALAVSSAAPAVASTASLEALHDFADSSPFADGCGLAGPAVPDAEVEPSIAVNPADPKNIVVAWQQDRFQDGAARGTVVGSSKDGGATWTQTTVPGLSKCTGEPRFDRSSDPWLSFGPGGVLYIATLSANLPVTGNVTAVAVNRSTDGGRSWTPPTFVAQDDGTYNDKETLTADPARPGFVYVIYTKRFTGASITYFAESRDSGATWSAPRPIYESPGTEAVGHIIVVAKDGSLVDLFALTTGGGEVTAAIVAMTSTDGGATWTQPALVSRMETNSGTDPDTANLVRAPAIPTAVVAPSGVVHVAWQQVNGPNAGQILMSDSSDSGKTWSEPTAVVSEPNQVIVPTLAALPDGTLGLSFYDFRDEKSGDDQLTTDYWLRHSHDEGKTWSETHLGGPFDLRSAVDASGYMVGDYVGMAATTDRFLSAFSMAKPEAKTGPNDIFFAATTTEPRPAATVPPASRCKDRRKFSFRLHHSRDARAVRVAVFVNGERKLLRRGRNIRRVTLARLPRTRFVVKVVSTLSTGAVRVSTRRYRGCRKGRRDTPGD